MRIIISPYSKPLRNGNRNPKNYPYWTDLISQLRGHELIQVGVRGEIPLVSDFRIDLNTSNLLSLLLSSDSFISVDNFFPHFASYYQKAGFVIFGPSDPIIFGHDIHFNISGGAYRENQFDVWESCEYNESLFPSADATLDVIVSNLNHGNKRYDCGCNP